jgi:hypothetical protein
MMTELQCIVFASLISADNDELEESVKQELIQRRDEKPEDWKYILEPLGEEYNKLLELFEYDNRKS